MDKLKEWFSSLAVDRVLPAVIIALVGLLVIRLVMAVVKRTLAKTKLEKAAHSLILSIFRIVLFLILFLVVASTLGVDVTSIVALASVVSLAISLAVQDMLANVFGGITLLSTHPFSSGDYVEIAGQSGTVQEIGMVYTKLTTPDNKLISLPNHAVTTAQIINYTITGTRRVEIPISAAYSIPTQKVIDALVLAGTMDHVLLEPAPRAVITEYADSAIRYSLRVWVKTEEYWDVHFALTQKVKDTFDEQGIEMTYPHLNVHLDK